MAKKVAENAAGNPALELSNRELSRWLKMWIPNAKLSNAVLLGGGTGARVYGLEYVERKAQQRIALRVTQSPVELCWRESLVLNTLCDQGLPVARCHGVQHRGKLACMMVDWLAGKPVFRPIDLPNYVDQAADLLAAIHEASVPSLKRRFETGMTRRIQSVSRLPGFEDLKDLLGGNVPKSRETVLLHGDFWPGNILYQRKALTGIVDWEDASLGSRMADLANARFELRWLWGEEAMRRFTIQYLAASGKQATDLARWDLVALIKPVLYRHNWGLNPSQERRVKQTISAVYAEARQSIA